jgi:uncharacterized integral membrane protein (TIGR00697 family)
MLNRFSKLEQGLILAGGYIALQMMSDIAASKVVKIGPLVMDAGLIYSLTFTWRDLIHKRLGASAARILILLAGAVNILMAAYFYLVIQLPPEPEWAKIGGQASWEFIFGLVPRVVVASIAAEIISELIDTQIYEWWVRKWPQKPQWSRVLMSNAVSIPVDSAIFVLLAFAGVLPVNVMVTAFFSNILIKALFTLGSFWMIYLVKEDPKGRVSKTMAKEIR